MVHALRSRLLGSGTRVLTASLLAVLCVSCATPPPTQQGQIGVDEDPIGGGISSSDVRTIASRMAPAVLAVPEVSARDGATRIAMAPMRNSSRFVFDMDIFMKRLRLELNRYGQGRVRFFSQGRAQVTRRAVLEGKNDARLQQALAQVGDEISELAVFGNAQRPPRIAVVPVLNCNFVNMNADSMMAMLRNEVASSATGRLQFLMPGTIDNADYLLTGQFIAESLKTEAIVDLSQYIQVVEERLKNGKSLSVYDDNAGNQIIVNLDAGRRPSILECIAANSQLRMPPNVTKRLSVMLVKADDKAAVYEKMVTLEEKLTEELGRADLVLSGEISGLSKRVQGLASDYLLITMQLVDPVTNELVWEDGYEIKKQSRAGIVYQ